MIRAQPGAGARPGRVLQQPRHHLQGAGPLRRGARRLSARGGARPRPRPGPQQPRRAAARRSGRCPRPRPPIGRRFDSIPDYAAAYHNLGILLGDTNRLREAVVCYCKVTTLSPEHKEARRLLAMAHCTLGEVDKAIAIMERWVAEEPDNPVPRHMLAAVFGPRRAGAGRRPVHRERSSTNSPPPSTSKLEHLAYRAPQIVAAMLADSGTPAAKALDVLDAGCGTGLCGPLVAPYARRLTGVDLSARMLAQAAGPAGLRRAREGRADRPTCAARPRRST